MKEIIKIAAGTALTVIFTVFTLGIINGSGPKQYSAKDIPGLGWTLKVSEQAGRSLGEKMRKSEPSPAIDKASA